MKGKEEKPSVDRLNQFIQVAFSIVWISPLLMFWLSAFGPLNPFQYEPIDTVASLVWFLICLSMSGMVHFLPQSYYSLRAFERSGQLYETLGVRYFKQWVSNGDLMNRWVRRTHPTYRLIKGPAYLPPFIDHTYTAEKIPLICLVMGVFTAGYAFKIGWYGWLSYLLVANLCFNFYPIILQRYLLARIDQVRKGRPGVV